MQFFAVVSAVAAACFAFVGAVVPEQPAKFPGTLEECMVVKKKDTFVARKYNSYKLENIVPKKNTDPVEEKQEIEEEQAIEQLPSQQQQIQETEEAVEEIQETEQEAEEPTEEEPLY